MNFLWKITDISNIKRIPFRNDINGLRAIAVLSVVFYHAGFEIFKGGWLGVDIFFVISGYLISNIIISDLNNGTFSFKNFYLRRVRRILPALFSIMLFTIPFAYLLLTPKAMQEYINSAIASIFFYANFYFMNLDFYVSESTKVMPLLHTWSLAIEEQYYLLFPLFAYFIYKYLKKYFTFFIGFIALISIYLNSLTQTTDKFYRIEFRMWELLLGVLIMILGNNLQIRHLEKIGIPLMLFPIIYYGDSSINNIEPKLIALTGISLIIFSNTTSTFLTKLLSLKFITIIGLSSYSIYLLHQPIFAFFRIYFTSIQWSNYLDSSLSIVQIVLALVLTFLISVLNYQKVETYFLKSLNYKLIFTLFFSVGVSIFVLSDAKNVVEYEDSKLYDYSINLENYTANLDGQLCHVDKNNNINSIDKICSFNSGAEQKIILLGDSQSRELGYLLSKKLTNYNFEIFTGNSCLFIFSEKYINECSLNVIDENIKEYIAKQKDTIIIYSGDIWDVTYQDNDLEKNITYTINKLISGNNTVIAIEQIPNIPFNPIDKLSTNINKRNLPIGVEYSYWKDEKTQKTLLDVYKNINSTNLFLISPEKYLCNNLIKEICVIATEEALYYRDNSHLTIDGVNLFLEDIVLLIDKAAD